VACEDAPLETQQVIGEIEHELLTLKLVRTSVLRCQSYILALSQFGDDSRVLKAQEEKGKGRPEELPMMPSEFIFHFPRLYSR